MIERPYYEVVIRLPLDLYDEDWFDCVAAAAGDNAAVSGDVVPEFPPSISPEAPRPIPYQGLLGLPLTRLRDHEATVCSGCCRYRVPHDS